MLDARRKRLRDWLIDDLQGHVALYPYSVAAVSNSPLPEVLAARVHRVRLEATAVLLLDYWR